MPSPFSVTKTFLDQNHIAAKIYFWMQNFEDLDVKNGKVSCAV